MARSLLNGEVELTTDDVAYLNGLCAKFDDLPDGAWRYSCEDAIAQDDRFLELDPFSVWLAWVEATGKEVES